MTGSLQRSLLNRYVGTETEYAFHFDRQFESAAGHTHIISKVIESLQSRLPTASAMGPKGGIFLSNGAAVFPEREYEGPEIGLIEAATPECRSPRDVLAHGRALDSLLAAAVKNARFETEVRLIKNCRDGHGNVYGAQENYDAEFARGLPLALWRIGVLILGLVAIVANVVCLVMAAFFITLLILLVMLLLFVALVSRRWGRQLTDRLMAPRTLAIAGQIVKVPFVAVSLIWAAPLVLLIRLVGFRRYTAKLLPFLASRMIFGGAGYQDANDEFQLSDKAAAIRRISGVSGLTGRAVFELGHFVKVLIRTTWLRPRMLAGLLRSRQRLQISVGDSNLSEHAEYLRIGATLLVLDAIEHGLLDASPVLQSPVASLLAICRDPSLQAKVPFRDGSHESAIEIQKRYLAACKALVAESSDQNREARYILELWEETLTQLQDSRAELVGKIDWVTKHYLIHQLGSTATPSSRKKVDLRYHELSPSGYFNQLKQTELVVAILDKGEIENAKLIPPQDTRAASRGKLIQENRRTSRKLYADWDRVKIGWGPKSKKVKLDS